VRLAAQDAERRLEQELGEVNFRFFPRTLVEATQILNHRFRRAIRLLARSLARGHRPTTTPAPASLCPRLALCSCVGRNSLLCGATLTELMLTWRRSDEPLWAAIDHWHRKRGVSPRIYSATSRFARRCRP